MVRMVKGVERDEFDKKCNHLNEAVIVRLPCFKTTNTALSANT
jgi:hypothetical protein